MNETLEDNGYLNYEISNWAKPNHECRHNLQYWRSLPYLAFGAGAHGYASSYRYSNVLRIKTYIERLTNPQSTNYQFPLTPATVNQHKQTLKDDMSEFMMTGLRLTQDGISLNDFQTRFGQSIQDVFGKEINELMKLGLIEKQTSELFKNSEVIRLTKRARLLGNQVFMQFV